MTGQSEFRAALFDPALAVPPGLTDPQGRSAGKRFDVYRNNVVMSLIEALQSSFPVIRKLVGDEFFDGMARLFVRQHPPTSPLLMFYGAEMPGFLAGFEPAAHLGYLPDMARLELAMRRSYHAADATPIDPAALSAIAPERLDAVRITLTPATMLVRSDWPLHAIWRFNMVDGAAKPVMRPEDVLILRQGFDPVPHLVPKGGAALIAALIAGQTLGQAAETVTDPDLDLGATLGLLLQGQAIHLITCEA